MLSPTMKIVVVDDHDRFRESLITMLETDPGLSVVGAGSSAADAIELANTVHPHMIVLDLDMPGNGLYAAEVIRKASATIKIVMLTASTDTTSIQTAQECGADGYIIKGITSRVLIRTLRSIYEGAESWPAAAVMPPPTRVRAVSGA